MLRQPRPPVHPLTCPAIATYWQSDLQPITHIVPQNAPLQRFVVTKKVVYLLSSKFFRPKITKSSNFIRAFSTESSKSDNVHVPCARSRHEKIFSLILIFESRHHSPSAFCRLRSHGWRIDGGHRRTTGGTGWPGCCSRGIRH